MTISQFRFYFQTLPRQYVALNPPLEDRAYVIRDILDSKRWRDFSIVTSDSSENNVFIDKLQSLTVGARRDTLWNIKPVISFPSKLSTLDSSIPFVMERLKQSQTKVVILQAGLVETRRMLTAAKRYNMDSDIVWIIPQTFLKLPRSRPNSFPDKILLVRSSRETSPDDVFHNAINDAVGLIALALDKMLREGKYIHSSRAICWKPQTSRLRSNPSLYE